MTPLVSVCIPTFNGELYIEHAIKSVFDQTYNNLEVIISDDGSTDNTLNVVYKLQSNTSIPFHIYNHERSSIGANWNNCVQHANGQYIKFLFQDDILMSSCIEKMIGKAIDNKKVGLVFCKREFIYDKSNQKHQEWIKMHKNIHKYWPELKSYQRGSCLIKAENLLELPRNKVGEPTAVLLNKDVFKNVGYFNVNLKQALDYEFWYRVFTKFYISFINEKLIYFRLHDNQATVHNKNNGILDYQIYHHLVYKNCFMQLSNKLKKELFLKYNPLGKMLNKIIIKCQRFLLL